MVYCVHCQYDSALRYTLMPVVTVNLCSGKGKGLIVEWCLGEPLQDLPCLWSHQGHHSIMRGDVTDSDRGREVVGDPCSHVGHLGRGTHYKVPGKEGEAGEGEEKEGEEGK